MAAYADVAELRPLPRERRLRFDRIAITSVFGDPLDPATWSGAPCRLSAALRRRGVAVEGFEPRLGRFRHAALAVCHLVRRFGARLTNEHLSRSAPARDHRACEIAAFIARRGIRHVLHTGTLDLPAFDLLDGIKHYLYCDQTWSLSLPHRLDAGRLSTEALREYERLERQSLRGLEHIFTFSRRVRDEIIGHYGVPENRVTAVGSGMGEIEANFAAKSYAAPNLLFVAKHMFREKGGDLLVEAVARARRSRPDLKLTIVGNAHGRKRLSAGANLELRGHVPWNELQRLYRSATLLAQPMLNDPWGQVFLEALISRTPVLGLNRHGLPEILEGGRHGFLVDRADADALAGAILAALSDPRRLAEMGWSGQRRVMELYSWDRVAERIAFV
jgi:glycosyltransferase involved in cell wall biosynthesis